MTFIRDVIALLKKRPKECFECGSRKNTYKSITGKIVCTYCAGFAIAKANELLRNRNHD
jgi:hypothetical protein